MRRRITRLLLSPKTHRVAALLAGQVLVLAAVAWLTVGAVAGLVLGVELVAWALLSDDGSAAR